MTLSYLWAKFALIGRGAAIRNSQIDRTSRVQAGSSVVGSRFERHSFCGYDCTIVYGDIGPFCSIANRVSIGGAMHPTHFVSTSPAFLSHKDIIKTKFARHEFLPMPRTKIGADVWIGEGAFVKAGVTVGDGAVIGMGAVVTRDVPPYSVVAGNPAKLIRYRFEERVIQGLLDSNWWQWPDEKLHAFGPYMNNPREFLGRLNLL